MSKLVQAGGTAKTTTTAALGVLLARSGVPTHLIDMDPQASLTRGRIKQSLGSIGYMELGFAKRLDLKMALLQNRAGPFVRASAESGRAALGSAPLPGNLRLFFPDPEGADSYPIVTLSWVLLYKDYGDAKKAAALRELLKWCLTEGQKSSEQLGYLPLSPNIIAPAIAAVDSIGPR